MPDVLQRSQQNSLKTLWQSTMVVCPPLQTLSSHLETGSIVMHQ